ncbi:MAG TPA: ABC transporter ATP-binding protein [Thermoanaerobaculia bacterium]|nr:ABC transporter ATP-binding protein [Thermoanaerobaculia bacterium]
MTLLVARALGVTVAGRRLLEPLDLEVSAGEALVVVGPNGAGKTTLLRALAGLPPAADGEVRLGGEPLAALPRRLLARRLAYLPQQAPDELPLTVARYVLLGRYAHLAGLLAAAGEEDRTAVAEAISRTGLDALADRPLGELSGGERQRAHLAAALAQEAPLWLLDEPTTHLDPRHQRQIVTLLRQLRRDRGLTLVLATHDLNVAGAVADRVACLDGGRLLSVGTPAEVLTRERLGRLYGAPFRVDRAGGATRVWLEL